MLHLTQDINSAEWEKEEKITNICISLLFPVLNNKCFNLLFALKLAQLPLVQQVQSVFLFQQLPILREFNVLHPLIQQIHFLVFVLQLLPHLQTEHLNKLLQLQNFKKQKNKLVVLEPLLNFADGNLDLP